jgi:hypothetical protein
VSFIIVFAFAAFLYLILTLQLSSGFPPFYEKYEGPMEDQIKPVLPFIFLLFAILLAAAVLPEGISLFGVVSAFALFGVVSAWCAVRVRRSVRRRTKGPLPWLLTPLTIRAMNRWPMLVFDAWTLGWSAALSGVMMATFFTPG